MLLREFREMRHQRHHALPVRVDVDMVTRGAGSVQSLSIKSSIGNADMIAHLLKPRWEIAQSFNNSEYNIVIAPRIETSDVARLGPDETPCISVTRS